MSILPFFCNFGQLSRNKSKILIIGDSQSSDILGGINSSIATCWYNPKNTVPKYHSEYEIHTLEEIKNRGL